MLAVTTPTITGSRTRDPSAMSIPEAIPAAGQNTATPSGFVNRTRLS